MNSVKIRLRAVEPEDVDFMLECESDPSACKWSDYTAPLSRQQLLTYALTYDADAFSAGQLRLIAVSGEGEMVGIVDFYDISAKDSKAKIGLTINPRQRRRGYGKQALLAAIDYARNILGLNQLTSKVSTQNSEALRLFVEVGFRQVAILPDWHRIGSDFHDFALLTFPLTNPLTPEI